MNTMPAGHDLVAVWREFDPQAMSGAALRRLVDRDTRRLRWLSRTEVMLTLLILAAFAAAFRRLPAPDRWVWLTATVLHVATVYGFVTWNRRGTWAPMGRSTQDYLRLARLRLVRTRRSALFVAGLIAVEGAVTAYFVIRSPAAVGDIPLAGIAAVVGVTAGAAAWYRRRMARELARLTDSAAALDGPAVID